MLGKEGDMSSTGFQYVASEHDPARVLVVDDDEIVARTLGRLLVREGYAVTVSGDVDSALAAIEGAEHDVVVCDVKMPGTDGLDLLRRLKRSAFDLPVIFVTGVPNVDDAALALEYGAFRYLTKPVAVDVLRSAVQEAVRIHRLAVASRAGLPLGRDELERRFRRAVRGLQIVFQPIVEVRTRVVYGYEVLMRSNEPTLPSPPAILEAAEKLGALHLVGRQVRAMVSEQAQASPPGTLFFVNVHSADLADPELFDPASPLSQFASSVVLELTERASLEGVAEVEARVARLRGLGYRLAVDDLGAGYAGLSHVVRLRPEIVKVDISLTRGIDRDPVRKHVVASICALAHTLGMRTVAEGVETRSERDAVIEAGADYVQGYGIARPARPFPEICWD
jgi:EAL domain-containing protein (putative c-di-GMP-specific phosphodiesterase class I)